MKKLFWQSEWQGIKFKNINTPKNVFHLPTSDFYSAFYTELFKRYKSYNDLPIKWQNDKKGIADEIVKLLKHNKDALSIGCGLGFVEKEIIKSLPDLKIDAYDYASNANKWLLDVEKVESLNSLNKNYKYKFIYCTGLLYALKENEISKLAEFIKKHLDKDGVFLTVDTSLNLNENLEKSIEGDAQLNQSKNTNLGILNKFNLIKILKDLFRPYYYFIFKRNKYQLWGWKRDNYEIKLIFNKNGFSTLKTYSGANQSFIMFNLKDNS